MGALWLLTHTLADARMCFGWRLPRVPGVRASGVRESTSQPFRRASTAFIIGSRYYPHGCAVLGLSDRADATGEGITIGPFL
jgi:hypothetical protein